MTTLNIDRRRHSQGQTFQNNESSLEYCDAHIYSSISISEEHSLTLGFPRTVHHTLRMTYHSRLLPIRHSRIKVLRTFRPGREIIIDNYNTDRIGIAARNNQPANLLKLRSRLFVQDVFFFYLVNGFIELRAKKWWKRKEKKNIMSPRALLLTRAREEAHVSLP